MYKKRVCETDLSHILEMKRLCARKYNIHNVSGTVNKVFVWCGETYIVIDGVEYRFLAEEFLKRFRRYIDVGDIIDLTYLVDQYGVTRIVRIINEAKLTEYVSIKNSCAMEVTKRTNSSTT